MLDALKVKEKAKIATQITDNMANETAKDMMEALRQRPQELSPKEQKKSAMSVVAKTI
jgi:CHASE3 domain sensor protein